MAGVKRKAKKKTGPEPMMVSVRGVLYKDAKECAKAFGITRQAVYKRVAEGRPDRIGIGKGRIPQGNITPRGVITNIMGVEFPSRKAAARALNCAPRTIYRFLEPEPPKLTVKHLRKKLIIYLENKIREKAARG